MYNITADNMNFKAKNQEKNYRSKSYARAIVFYRRMENSEGTNQIRGFLTEHRWVCSNIKSEGFLLRFKKLLLN